MSLSLDVNRARKSKEPLETTPCGDAMSDVIMAAALEWQGETEIIFRLKECLADIDATGSHFTAAALLGSTIDALCLSIYGVDDSTRMEQLKIRSDIYKAGKLRQSSSLRRKLYPVKPEA
jgi:hypothetical protein